MAGSSSDTSKGGAEGSNVWNDLCAVQGRDAIHGCSVVLLVARRSSKALTGKYDLF